MTATGPTMERAGGETTGCGSEGSADDDNGVSRGGALEVVAIGASGGGALDVVATGVLW